MLLLRATEALSMFSLRERCAAFLCKFVEGCFVLNSWTLSDRLLFIYLFSLLLLLFEHLHEITLSNFERNKFCFSATLD